jgi:deoxyribose-phosphate aldolase
MDAASGAAVAGRAIPLLDLTDLGEDTTAEAARVLSDRAAAAGVAAVCVWPRFVAVCAPMLRGTSVAVATVVNFPAGTDPADRVAADAATAVAAGADEVDVVLPYRAWLAGDHQRGADVLAAARAETAGRVLKVIIETGELPDRAAIDRAAMFAIEHGADFVKTSTGKTPVSATPEAAEIVLEAIAVSGRPVGFKASGGIRTVADAATYLRLADDIMGPEWATPATFRFGASSLLDALQRASEC